MLYSKIGGVLRWSGGMLTLREGQSIDEDHPLVQERPDLWTADAPGAHIQTRATPGKVETNVQVPGGQRSTRVPRNPNAGSGQ